MKKLVLLLAVVFSVSLFSCNNAEQTEATVDSAIEATVDSANAVIDSAAQKVDSAAQVVDSAAQAVAEKVEEVAK